MSHIRSQAHGTLISLPVSYPCNVYSIYGCVLNEIPHLLNCYYIIIFNFFKIIIIIFNNNLNYSIT